MQDHPASRYLALLGLAVSMLVATSGCAHRRIACGLPVEAPPPFSASGESITPDRWWRTFQDPGLDAQIELALGENFELAAAVQRIRAARAVARREASSLLPDLDGVSFGDSQFGPGPDDSFMSWGLDVSYQVDLWGQIRSRVDAERFRASATAADYQAVALVLAYDIAQTWFSLVEANAQADLLEEQISTNRTGLQAMEYRFGLGEVLSPDVLRQRQLVESTLEQLVVARARIETLEHQLAVLTGQMPQTAMYDPGVQLPALPPLPSTGLPSELITRRPDVRRDYLALAAADRDVAAAISARYPRLSLTGSVINAAENPETLFRDWFVSIGTQLIAPLIDGGERRAEVDRTSAVVRQRFNEYGQTILIAFREVEDALALEKYQLARIERLENQVVLAGQASAQLREQYLFQLADYLDVLSAITAQQRLQRETLAARLDLIIIRMNLYSALAGGFDTTPQVIQMSAELPPPDQAGPVVRPAENVLDE